MNTSLRGAIASLFLLGSLSGAQATDEVLVRLAPNYATPEHAALLVQGWGKVLMREAPGSYRVVLNGRIPMPEALSRLAGRTGVVSARRSWRPGVAGLTNDLSELSEMIAEMKQTGREKGIDAEEAGVDYFEAYQDYIAQRAYPNKTVDWAAYKNAERHRAAEPDPPLRRHLPGLQRLHAPGRSPCGADEAARHLHLDPRLDRPGRGRLDPPAGRASRRAARHPRAGRRPAR